MKKVTTQYEDIINFPHHVSATHPQMSAIDRAAQFSPFAALTGYEAAIKETGRLTENYLDLDESRKAELDAKLQSLARRLKATSGDGPPEISINYFLPDERKDGGAYVRISGKVKKIDEYRRLLRMNDGGEIPIDHIYEIEEI